MKLLPVIFVLFVFCSHAQQKMYTLLKADRVFDGEQMHTGWSVLVVNDRVEQVGVITNVPTGTKTIELPGSTLMPGMIEGHAHLFLHPYNETSWNDQVLTESRAERTARAVNHARATLLAGFTTVRDLGTEGSFYDDAGLKKAIEKKVIPGPRMIIATRAIVAKGSYGPRSLSADIEVPQGAAEVSGLIEMGNEVRTEIGKGADVIKIYADYRWGTNEQALPTFSIEEMAVAVAIANSGGRAVVAHATTPEGMRRAISAGVATIEHGDNGTADIFKLMKERNVALCPTLAAGDATSQYKGWKKGIDPEPQKITEKKRSFKLALSSGVTICMGGDVGVFSHGDNAREMEMMVEYGMKPQEVLKSATSINAKVFGYGSELGKLQPGFFADIIAVKGNPAENIRVIRNVELVMKNGLLYTSPM